MGIPMSMSQGGSQPSKLAGPWGKFGTAQAICQGVDGCQLNTAKEPGDYPRDHYCNK